MSGTFSETDCPSHFESETKRRDRPTARLPLLIERVLLLRNTRFLKNLETASRPPWIRIVRRDFSVLMFIIHNLQSSYTSFMPESTLYLQ